jgi:hypothetical protein
MITKTTMVSSSENSIAAPDEKSGKATYAVVETTLTNERNGFRISGDGEDHEHEPPVRFFTPAPEPIRRISLAD